MKVPLERFERTEQEKEIDRAFGRLTEVEQIHRDIAKTFHKYRAKYRTDDITVITDKAKQDNYYDGTLLIKVRNKAF